MSVFFAKRANLRGEIAFRPLKYGTPISSRKTGPATAKQGR